jgi:large subunit ribosomal protein L4e
MKVDVFDMNGKAAGKIDLPKVFSEKVRPDLIRRAVIAVTSVRQPYGVDPMAGKRTSAHYHGYRRHRWTMMNKEMARMPRIHGKVSPNLMWKARFVPQAKGGREAHPPKVEKIWLERINQKEKRKAVRSAIAATAVRELVLSHGHRLGTIEQLPIVVDDKFQEIKKSKTLSSFLVSIGLEDELEKLKERKVRAGKGKSRGRKYKRKMGPLIVIIKDDGIGKAAKNLNINVCRAENLSAAYLAPGGMPGRLAIYTQSALKKIGE